MFRQGNKGSIGMADKIKINQEYFLVLFAVLASPSAFLDFASVDYQFVSAFFLSHLFVTDSHRFAYHSSHLLHL